MQHTLGWVGFLGALSVGGWTIAAAQPVGSAEKAAKSEQDTTMLERFVVSAPAAAAFKASATPSVTLKTVDLLMTPGAAADINRALQTLPGVQMADEGNALFVRGGDSRETATWINGIRFPAQAQINAPLGAVAGSISPWQASGVEFTAGGFGASTGDVLSGAVKITTFGAPRERSASFNLGIGGVALSASQPWTERAGMTATVSRGDLRYFLDLFDSPRSFIDAPTDTSASVNGSWAFSGTGKVGWFAIRQSDGVALSVRDLNRTSVFRSGGDSNFGVVSWTERRGPWKHAVNIGGSELDREERIGDARWRTTKKSRQFSTVSSIDGGGFIWRGGAEGADETVKFVNVVEAWRIAAAGNGGYESSSVGGGDSDGAPRERRGCSRERLFTGWTELEVMATRRLRVVAGVRGWSSRLADQARIDPRLALTWQPKRGFTYSLAGGRYHQVAAGADYFDEAFQWPAMTADQVLAAFEWKGGGRQLRVETYEKRYRSLVASNRDFTPRGAGSGYARGLDIMGKTPLPGDGNARMTWSTVDAERTDPNSGGRVQAPWAVSHSVAVIVDYPIGAWKVALAGRWASGRAFTPIVGGRVDGVRTLPIFGAANSEHYPAFRRIDVTLARTWEISPRVSAVTYLAGFNLAGWRNVSGYEYADDFSSRRAVPGVFTRSLYFGVNFLFR